MGAAGVCFATASSSDRARASRGERCLAEGREPFAESYTASGDFPDASRAAARTWELFAEWRGRGFELPELPLKYGSRRIATTRFREGKYSSTVSVYALLYDSCVWMRGCSSSGAIWRLHLRVSLPETL